ncbi:MAG: polysaccharide biosynthesis/export family protein [Edaphobacter sp.]|uniref:polysaccharide biosynthesis/export family protein n=1 Tax=Edaphobacter sp. TaxID=1934404 RepID=UPI002386B8C1|nr:polysaccharide biosynthesis/export family protein [Edaphobacter sp.]MDE1178854.1 polysaccharide biosynthesis/export family protein [Edaphobacter sp.]
MAITNNAACFLIAFSLFSGVGNAQATPSSGQSAASQATPVASDRGPLENIPISSGDLLDVEVFSTPELSGKFRVDQEGFITLPVGGTVKVSGLLPAQTASIIQKHLVAEKLMLNPSVTVDIVEYSTEGVTVLGEVKSPGVYTLLGPRSLYDALAAAGGATTSEGSTITVTHANDASHPVVVNVTTPNYSPEQKATIVLPGDTVVVNRAPLVYIVGDVARSGAFFIQGGTTLTILNLLSLAQGANRTAAMGRAAIIRPEPDGTATTIHFNLDKVMKNEAPDLAMQAGDVLVLPRSGFKTFAATALPAATNSVTSAVVYSLIN